MKTSQNNSNNKTEKLDRAKMVILTIVPSLCCIVLHIHLLLNFRPENVLQVWLIFTPILVLLCIIFFLIENMKKRRIIARKEEESKMWFDESMRLFGIVQESKTHVENMQKEMDEKDPAISKQMQDLYKILSGGKPS